MILDQKQASKDGQRLALFSQLSQHSALNKLIYLFIYLINAQSKWFYGLHFSVEKFVSY